MKWYDDTLQHLDYLRRDATLTLLADWDIGDGWKILADEIRARDGDGLKLYDDGGNGIFVKDGGLIEIGSTPDYADVRPFKIYDNGVTGGARLTLINTTGLLGSGLELVDGGNAGRRCLIILADEGSLDYGLRFYTTDNNVVSETMRLRGDGKLGLGTITPQQMLHVNSSTTASYIKITNSGTGDGSGDGFDIATISGDVYLINRETGSMRFRTSNLDRMFIKSDGNIGVNTITPTTKLDVNSDKLRLRTAKTPATAGAAGNQGDHCWDADYFYICVAANTWERTPHAWDINVYDDAAETKLAGIETGANVGSKFMWAWVNWDDGNSSHQTLGSLPANAFVVRTFLHITTQFDDTVCVVSVGTTGDPDAYIQNYTLTAIAAGVKDDVVWGVNRGYRSGADGTVQTTLLTMGGDGTQGAVLVGIEYMVVGANS